MTASPSPFTLPEVTDVAISPNGSIVIASSFNSNEIRVLSFNQNSCSISDTGNSYTVYTPVNAEFSPDGKTLIVARAFSGKIEIFEVSGNTLIDRGDIDLNCGTVQSVAIYGNKAYIYCSGESPDKLAVLNITGPGQVSDTGIRIDLSVDSNDYLVYYGINQIAITPNGKYALVSSQEENNFVSVVDLSTNTEVRTIITSILCYDDPAFTPVLPSVLFDATEAQLSGTMDGYIPVKVEIILKDGGEPGYGRDYAEIKIKDMSDTVIYQISGFITSGSIYAMPLY